MRRFYDVVVLSHVDEEGGELWWNAEAGLADDLSMGVEHEAVRDVRDLLAEVHDDTIEYRRLWPDLKVRFFESDRKPAMEFFDALRKEGGTLPDWIDPKPCP